MAKDLDIEKTTPDASAEQKSQDKAKKPKEEKSKKAAKNGKPKKSIVKFFKDAKAEFKKVVWPTRKETTHNTAVVIIVCVLAALFIFGIDSLFALLNKLVLGMG